MKINIERNKLLKSKGIDLVVNEQPGLTNQDARNFLAMTTIEIMKEGNEDD